MSSGSMCASCTMYYFVSDLHIGGDAGLNEVEYEEEFIGFLQKVKEGPLPAELIIAGDAFGFWELSTVAHPYKLGWIISSHPRLFEQFRATGAVVTITIIPGNHDYDLFCIKAYRDELEQYNVHLELESYLVREVAGKKIWVEHGHLHDDFNRYNRYKDCHAVPLGYYITERVAAAAARSAPLGRSPWLKDLESVYPNEEIPRWLLSNYFYREMTPILRWVSAPFIAFFGVSLVVLIGGLLESMSVIDTRVFTTPLSQYFGLPGRLLDWIIWIDIIGIFLTIILAIPFGLLMRDIHKTLRRFGLNTSKALQLMKEDNYVHAAQQVFLQNPDVVVYLYGHTHIPSITGTSGRYIINTGTWLKRLERLEPRLRGFPSVYAPSYQLNYVIISSEGTRIIIRYSVIPKKIHQDATLLEKLLIIGRRNGRKQLSRIPAETIIE